MLRVSILARTSAGRMCKYFAVVDNHIFISSFFELDGCVPSSRGGKRATRSRILFLYISATTFGVHGYETDPPRSKEAT